MNFKVIFLVSIFCWFAINSTIVYSQNASVTSQIKSITSLEDSEILSFAPHFPLNEKNDEATINALQEWAKKYPQELNSFLNHPKYTENSFSWYPFGIDTENERIDEYLNDDLLEWLAIYKIDIEQLKEAAPHFPEVPNTDNKRDDAVLFSQLKVDWLKDYPQEFDQIMRLVYESYGIAPKNTPDFRSYRPTEEKPVWVEAEGNDRIVFEMKLQHWYYMFDQEKYRSIYGEPPALPEGYKSMEEYQEKNIKNDN